MSSDERAESDAQADAADAPGDTTDAPTTRWAWLSTVLTLLVSGVYLAVFAVVSLTDRALDANAYVLGAVTLAFLGVVAYAIGPETLKAVKDLRGGP